MRPAGLDPVGLVASPAGRGGGPILEIINHRNRDPPRCPAVERASKRTGLAQLPNPRGGTVPIDVSPPWRISPTCPNPWSRATVPQLSTADICLGELGKAPQRWEPAEAPPAFEASAGSRSSLIRIAPSEQRWTALSRLQCRVPEEDTFGRRVTCRSAATPSCDTSCVMPSSSPVSNPWLAPGEENTWSGPTDTSRTRGDLAELLFTRILP